MRVLGTVDLLVDGASVALSPLERALVAVLAESAGRIVPVDRLVAALWGEFAPRSAVNRVQALVSSIRRRAGEAAGGDLIATIPPGYRLSDHADTLDSARFAQLVTEARDHAGAGRLRDAAEAFRLALQLWRGEEFGGGSGWPDSDVSATMASLEESRLAAVEELMDAELGLGRHGAVVAELTSLVARHPFRERLRAQLMLALYRSGRQAEALAVYRSGYAVLADEFGTDPGEQLQRMHQAILAADPALNLVVSHPDQLTVGRESLAAIVPSQLPADVNDFTGRDELLRQLDEVVDNRDAPTAPAIVVLVGTAGVGKTASAVHWAHRVASRFPDGQLYINLRGCGPGQPVRPLEALALFLRGLGVPAEQIPADDEAAAGMYRSRMSGKNVLVILDNAASATQVRPLLPGDAGCLVLATSRDRLTGLSAHEGARRLRLECLTPDEAITLLGRMLGSQRVTTEADAAADLAAACCYLPLALRIAGAQLDDDPGRSLTKYLAALRTTGPLSALQISGDEQEGVRVAFDESYRALPPSAAQLFRLLGLIPGPDFTAAAAATLIDTAVEQASTLLDRLVTAHLIDRHPPDRHSFHDLLREYARKQAEATESADARQDAAGRLYVYYAAHSDQAARIVFPETLRLPRTPTAAGGFADRTAALAWLDAERANLVAAGAAAADDEPHREIAWLLADAMRRYFWIRADAVDWPILAEAGLAAATAAADPTAQAAAELGVGLADILANRYLAALDHLHRAIALSRQVGWPDCEAVTLGNLGIALTELGELQRAAIYFRRALALNERLGRRGGLATNLGNLGLLQLRMGQFRPARNHLARAVALYRGGGYLGNKAVFLSGLGRVNGYLGYLFEGLEQLAMALAICQELGDINDEVEAHSDLALLFGQLGRCTEATLHAEAAVARSASGTDLAVKATALAARATTRLRLGDHDQALVDSLAAVEAADNGSSQYVQLVALIGLAAAEQRRGDLDRARAHAHRAAAIAKAVGHRHLEGQALATLASTHLSRGAIRTAARHARQALEIHRETGGRIDQARLLVLIGRTLAEPRRRDYQAQARTILADVGIIDTAQQHALLELPNPAQIKIAEQTAR